MRTVSLLPSATEVVARLGRFEDLVGRSEECDYPPEVRALPAVMRARVLDGEDRSEVIDDRVRRTRAAGQSLYELDLPLLRSLRPELLLTQDLCGVCSVTEEEVRAACAGAGIAPQILSLSPRNLSEVVDTVRVIGAALGVAPDAEREVARLTEEFRADAPRTGERPTVAVVEWLDPPILAGLWVPEMISCAGARTWRGPEPGETAIRTSWEALAADPPDHLVLSPCSFSLERTRAELARPPIAAQVAPLLAREAWIADEAHFSRPGPRLAEGLSLLRAILSGDPPSSALPVEKLRIGVLRSAA
ncbi:MAG: cobalamin-binding protein [Thermoplasmata archaeon]|nr:cobalamin-binding protein [Thermoplasmata archaeon]